MEQIWAPWRIEYIQMQKPEGCILCDKPEQKDDVANYILYRGDNNFVIMNSYPYNPGHLMVAPYRHVANLEELTDEERHEHFGMVSRGVKLLKEVFGPAGFNIGMNIGKVAGAGIDDHIHTHIVPRWQGDTNFMPVIADVRVVPEALAETYKKLQGKF
jgi:ATP adenylyltransferase